MGEVTVWSVTVDYYDQTDAEVFATEDQCIAYLRDRFKVTHAQFTEDQELDLTQDQVNALPTEKFRELLVDYGICHEIREHTVIL